MTIFDYIIWIGVALTGAGLALLIYCIIKVGRAKRAGLSDDQMRTTLRQIVPVNLGALLLSALGLMAVATGLILR